MPTLYPKCAPSELLGLLSLIKRVKGSEEVARIADDESLEVDDILPSIEYAEGLGLVTVTDGRVSFTELGKKLASATIRAKKELLRDILGKTTLFRAIQRSLDSAVDGFLAEDELHQIVAFTTAPPEAVHTIITWGRYSDLFRYDANRHLIMPSGTRRAPKPPPPIAVPAAPPPPPPPPPGGTISPSAKVVPARPPTKPTATKPAPEKESPPPSSDPTSTAPPARTEPAPRRKLGVPA